MTAVAKADHHSTEAEQALLGALLIANDAFNHVVPTGLAPEHFYEPLHGHLYAEIARKIEAGQKVTPVTLKASFPEIDIAGMPLPQYLARLAAEATTIINAPDYARHIKSLALVRRMIGIGDNLRDSRSMAIAPDEALRQAIEDFDLLRLDVPAQAMRNIVNSAEGSASVAIERMTSIMQGVLPSGGLSTGIPELDAKLGGFRGGELTIIAARPGMGKTSVAGSLARAMAMPRQNKRTGEITQVGGLFFSLEMPEVQMGARVLAEIAYSPDLRCTCRATKDHRDFCPQDYIPYNLIMRGDISDERAERLVLAARSLAGLPLEIDYSINPTIGEIAAKIRTCARKMLSKWKCKLGIVWIDYTKFIKVADRYRGQRHLEIGEISAGLKMLAREIDIPIILLHQLNRQSEERADKRPELAGLRDTGELEQDADNVILLFREAYYLEIAGDLNTNADKQIRLQQCHDKIELILAKNRMGPVGSIAAHVMMKCAALRAPSFMDGRHALDIFEDFPQK